MIVDEAHVAMSLNHSNIVQVLDLGQSKGRYFLVLELVDGWDLNQIITRMRKAEFPLPPEVSLYVGAEVCRALNYAHAQTREGKPLGIVHRDVSPHNVLVSEHGEVKLTDFGIAKAAVGRRERTGQGIIKGKLAFMSPEQASGGELDARSDLFSVGTMLYLMVTGRRPFEAPTDLEIILRVQQGQFPPPTEIKPESARGDRPHHRAGDEEGASRSLPDRRGDAAGSGGRPAQRLQAGRPDRAAPLAAGAGPEGPRPAHQPAAPRRRSTSPKRCPSRARTSCSRPRSAWRRCRRPSAPKGNTASSVIRAAESLQSPSLFEAETAAAHVRHGPGTRAAARRCCRRPSRCRQRAAPLAGGRAGGGRGAPPRACCGCCACARTGPARSPGCPLPARRPAAAGAPCGPTGNAHGAHGTTGDAAAGVDACPRAVRRRARGQPRIRAATRTNGRDRTPPAMSPGTPAGTPRTTRQPEEEEDEEALLKQKEPDIADKVIGADVPLPGRRR